MKGHALRLADGLARIGQKLVEGELLGNGAVVERPEQITVDAVQPVGGAGRLQDCRNCPHPAMRH